VRIPPRSNYHEIELDEISVEDDETPFHETSDWWESIMHGSPGRKLPREQVKWLINRVLERVLPEEDETTPVSFQIAVGDGDEPVDAGENWAELSEVPNKAVTVGELRDQLQRIAQMLDSEELVAAVITEGLEAARTAEEQTRLAADEAKRFIESHLMPPENVMASTASFERSLLSAITRHMTMLSNLQARRRGEFVPPPVTVDVNVTAAD